MLRIVVCSLNNESCQGTGIAVTCDQKSSLPTRVKHHLSSGRSRLTLIFATLLLAPLLLFWRPLQRQCLTYVLLRSDAPSTEVLSELVAKTGDPVLLLKRLWQTQRIPHRRFVLSYLGRTLNETPIVFRAMEAIMLNALSDADIEARELAFAALARAKHPELRGLALEQLKDVDPAVRVLGLQTLRSVAISNDVPIAIGLLSDPEPRVVVAAALVLRQVTGHDVGIRSSHALPQFTGFGTNAPAPPDLKAIGQGVQGWQDWWNEHKNEYPDSSQRSGARSKPAGLATPDFTLMDSNRKPVHLSDFRGKAVLLAFGCPDSPASLGATPVLAALQQRNLERLAVLGVCVLPTSSCADEHEHKSEHAEHHHDGVSPLFSNPVQTPEPIRETAVEHKITYPMLLDSKGTVGLCFGVENLPAFVLIDPQGMVRRRFVGDRNNQVLQAMIDEVSNPNTEHAMKPFIL